MSAKIIPWPARTAITACKPVSFLPALIDRHVPVRALRKGLAAAGLRLEHDLVTGNLVILPTPTHCV
jgi:hypothetical protein